VTRRKPLWVEIITLNWHLSPVRCVLIAALLLLGIASPLATALALKSLTDNALAGAGGSALAAAGVAAAAYALGGLAFGVRDTLLMDVRDRVGHVLGERLLTATAATPTIAHLEDPEGLDRLDTAWRGGLRDVANIVWMVAQTVATVVSVAGSLLVLSAVSPMLLLTLPLAIPTVLLNQVGQRRLSCAREAAMEADRTAANLLDNTFDPVWGAELRVTEAGSPLLDEYQRRWNEAIRIQQRARWQAAALLACGWLVFLAGFLGGVAWTVHEIVRGNGTAGDAILMMTVARQQQDLVSGVVRGTRQVMQALHPYRAYAWLMDRIGEVKPVKDPQPVPERMADGIVLEKVSFGYPGTGRKVLRQVDLELPAGSMVALVGAHGSGKTTLVKLLTQMYGPTAGRITLDGHDLARFEPEEWRSRITCAFQDFIKYETTLGESIGIGDLSHVGDTERITRALAHAGGEGLPAKLPDGLATKLGNLYEDGVQMSLGQWQKTALGRACMREAPVLMILDEPTASLDAPSEYEVFQRHVALSRELGERYGTVTVVVSHRYSTVRMADKIVVLRDGAILEEGPHDVLMKKTGGAYADMYRLQKEAYQQTAV